MVDLRLVPIETVLPHEVTSADRALKLLDSIKKYELIKNPIQAVEYEDKFIILDGHHRFNALRELKVNYIPLQVVNLENVTTEYWYHTFLEPLNIIENEDNLDSAYIGQCKSGKRIIELNIGNEDKLSYVWSVFKSYEDYPYNRSHIEIADSNWVTFNGVTIQDIMGWAKNHQLTPPGITRFLIQYRLLNLNIPISLLYEIQKNKWDKVLERVNQGRVYHESTISIEV
ncbi:ParB N-terminal domain-containing protein [Bacillus cereus group sp. Bce005]|uniref:ParB N-terminal domain-containing protein n=1 Tax=Bacillus cereus group TaxID=86661 RepID=UPI001419D7E1|nr:ParB N-terminal domain-containing protein [Bacillus albus]